MNRPLVIGHRGSPRVAIENTIESFDAAEAAGVDGIEFDIRVTACGELVLHHPPDFHEDGRQFMISTLSLREIRERVPEVDGEPYRIPTLDEVFDRYRHDLLYFVELKPCNLPVQGIYEQAVARLVRRHGLEQHCLVCSFSTDLVRRVAAVAPEIRTSLIFEHGAAVAELGAPGSTFPPVSALHPKQSVLDEELASRAAAAGLDVHTWMINDPADLERFVALGVVSVTTDDPARIVAALGRPPRSARAVPLHAGSDD
jgi:glycerophosphoryl diester phosphodiesterase